MRDCAKKANTSYTMVQRIKTRNDLKAHKMQKQPKRSEKQTATGKSRGRKLYDKVLAKKNMYAIMDYETYVKFDYPKLLGPQFHTVEKGSNVDIQDKSVLCDKFDQKVLIWQAIC